MDYNCSVFTIKDKLCKKAGMTAEWVNNSGLLVRAFKPILSSTKDGESEFSGQHCVYVHHLQPNFIFKDPILRGFLAETNSIFLTLHKIGKQGQKSDYIKLSRAYRSIIRAYLDKLQEAVTSENISNDDKIKYEDYITIFYSIECVWHLCEILVIDPAPSNIVVPQLLEWIRFHFPTAERNAVDLLLHGPDADSKEEYWPTIKGLILQGQTDVARALLKLHSLCETSEFKVAEQILKTMPTFNIYEQISLQKFHSRWQYWLNDTEFKLVSGVMSSEPELENIIKLISGGRNTIIWNEILQKSDYWYEYFPGFLFYSKPACKHFELGTLANCWLSQWAIAKDDGNSHYLKLLDRIILSLMENNIHQVLQLIQKICDNQWFVTHLTDLLYHCGKLSIVGENGKNEAANIRSTLLFEFGLNLMSYKPLWLFGMDYLENYSNENQEGLAAIETMLLCLPIINEKDAIKIISAAKQRNLFSVEQEICKVQSKKLMTIGRYGNALEWAIRSNDSNFVSQISDFFLKNYLETGKISCSDILLNVGPKMFTSPRLVVLVKFLDFLKLYERQEYVSAAELLVNLLDSKIIPEYFWSALLVNSISLLESKDPKIPSKNNYIILQHVEAALTYLLKKKKEEIKDSSDKVMINFLKHYNFEDLEQLLKLVRLACARNLSRSIILENTIIS